MASKFLNLANQINYATWYGIFRREFLQPTSVIDIFNDLEIPSNIKFVILDKDNCFAKPHKTSVWPTFQSRWNALVSQNHKQYEVCVLSNTAGDASSDPSNELAQNLENELGIRVLRHEKKKPMCYDEVKAMLPCKPEDVLVVGDRLMTDVLMANLLGAKSVWIRPGVHPSAFNRIEISLAKMLNIKH